MLNSTGQIRVSDISKLDVYENKRDCYAEIRDFIDSRRGTKGQICAIFGLRRTGKTVMLSQMAQEMEKSGHKCLYLVCTDEYENIDYDKRNGIRHTPEIRELFDLFEQAIEENYEYVFVDEITFIRDFVGQGNVISNYYANQGLNIIATGTDSLSFSLAARDDMLDRIKIIRTSYVSFAEYHRLSGKDIDHYIAFGGTLAEESPYKSGSSTIAYTNSAIVKNIIRSISNSEHNNPGAITLFYPEKDIVSAINRCIDQMNQAFLVSAINRNGGVFESHPLHLGLNNAKSFPYAEYIDVLTVDEKVKESLRILNKDETEVELKQSDIDIIRKALEELDLVLSVPAYNETKGILERDGDIQLLSQAGMIYCHATELLQILTNEENWRKLEKCGAENKNLFLRRIDRQVKGDILENMVLYDTFQALKDNYIVTKIRRKTDNREVDVAVIDRTTKDASLFEVKYADYADPAQLKNLSSASFLKDISERFGQIKGRFVIYMGKPDFLEDPFGRVGFIPANDYLSALSHCDRINDLIAHCLPDLDNIY